MKNKRHDGVNGFFCFFLSIVREGGRVPYHGQRWRPDTDAQEPHHRRKRQELRRRKRDVPDKAGGRAVSVQHIINNFKKKLPSTYGGRFTTLIPE